MFTVYWLYKWNKIDKVKSLCTVMVIYNLIEHRDSYLKASRTITTSRSFTLELVLLYNTNNPGNTFIEIAVPLKYLK